jgi:hypothetical protein
MKALKPILLMDGLFLMALPLVLHARFHSPLSFGRGVFRHGRIFSSVRSWQQ